MPDPTLDPAQQAAAAALDALLDRRGRVRRPGGPRPAGVYLHGRPGRGKTMLMDRFFTATTSKHKARLHFHRFFADLSAAVRITGSMRTAVDMVVGDVALLCFDEFQVDDIGDGMLIARLLDVLIARRVLVIVTANQAPAELLPNPIFHEQFEPTIALITERFTVLPVDGPRDYRACGERAAGGFAGGTYRITGVVPALPPPGRPVRRALRPVPAGDGVALPFTAVCGDAGAAGDYLALVAAHPRITLTGVPPLRLVPPSWTARLVTFVDVMHDAGAHLTVEATVPPAELAAGTTPIPGLARMLSRLAELKPVPSS
ncbi:cell division protein ZapE [Nocardia sp. NPDC057353]|uniref:cell division protein ZapE n=1 Tax=Nocardia sp. NPDC057353 TaxID=3346104 RepID=UPI0036345430